MADEEKRPPEMVGETDRERGYIEGRRFTLVKVLTQALIDLKEFGSPADDPLIKLAVLVKERQETVSKLREVCEEFGDNDWPETLWLPDVIECHLFRTLQQNAVED